MKKNKESLVDIFLRECLIVYLELPMQFLPMQFFFERVVCCFCASFMRKKIITSRKMSRISGEQRRGCLDQYRHTHASTVNNATVWYDEDTKSFVANDVVAKVRIPFLLGNSSPFTVPLWGSPLLLHCCVRKQPRLLRVPVQVYF